MPDSTQIYQKFTKDTIIVGVTQLSLMLKGLILLPVITKLLGVANYGIWVQVGVTLSLIGGLTGIGSFAFIRFFAGETNKEKIRNGFFSLLIFIFSLSCLVALILFFFATPLAETLFGGREAANIVRLSALILPFFSVNSLFFFFFRTFRKMKLYGLLLLVQSYAEIGIVMVLILRGGGIFGVVLAMLITYLASELVMLFLIVREVGLGFPPISSFVKMKDYLRFDLPFLPSNLCLWIANTSDRYVIAIFLGIAATGIYSAGYTLGAITMLYLGPLNIVLVPALAHLYDNNKIQEVKNHLTYSLKYFLLLAIPSAAGLSLLAKPVLQVLTTPEFATAGSTVVPLVAASMILRGAGGIITQPINLVKRTGIVGIAWGIAAALNLGLNLFLIPRWGIIAAAITTLLSFAVASTLTSYVSFKYLKFDIDWMFILKSLFATAVMSIVILLFNPTGLPVLLYTVAIGAMAYFVMIYLMKGLTPEEISFFKNLVLSLKPARGEIGKS